MTNRQVLVLVVVLAGLLLVLPCLLVVGGIAAWCLYPSSTLPPAVRQGDPEPVPASGEGGRGIPAPRPMRGESLLP
jgi:hypothetical protein